MTAWFATWVLLGPALLQVIGQTGPAHAMAEWRGLVVPVSAALLHYAFHRDEGPQALALGLLLAVGFWIYRLSPPTATENCYGEDCPLSEGGFGGTAVLIAALVLTYYRPGEERLRNRLRHTRDFLVHAGARPEKIDAVMEGKARYDEPLLPG